MVCIVGAGAAGLIAGRLLAFRHDPTIYEKQSDLPNNHHALLRFKTGAIGEAVGIPFKRVMMIKDTAPWRNPVAAALSYSYKNSRVYRSDRSIQAGFVYEPRYIAPRNFLGQLSRNQCIKYGVDYMFREQNGDPVVSTIPMPRLMELLGYEDKSLCFISASGSVIRATVKDCDAYVSLVVPDPSYQFSRISITGDELIIEFPLPADSVVTDQVSRACQLIGISYGDVIDVRGPYSQSYNKIMPLNDEARKQFIWWATDQHNVYSLGRFATWRPGLLLDDLLRDIQLIDQWISRRERYNIAKHRR